MAQANFRVILTGNTLQEFEEKRVVQAAALLFKCSEEHAQQFFTGKPTPLKREMDQVTAQRYHDRLRQAGIDCRIEAVTENSGLTLELEPSETSPKLSSTGATVTAEAGNGSGSTSLELVKDSDSSNDASTQMDTRFRCPKCQTPQDKGAECINCGIIFSKYQVPPIEMTDVEQERESDTNDEWDELVLFVGENIEAYRHKFREIYTKDGMFVLQWHWPAFLITIPWLIFRKMYMWALSFYLIVLVTPWYLSIIVALLPGFFGNYLYYRHAMSHINKIKSTGQERRDDIFKAGGTNSIPITIGITFLAGLIMSIVMYQLIVSPVMEKAVNQGSSDASFISDDDSRGTKVTKLKMILMKKTLLLEKRALGNKPNFHMPTDMDELMKHMGNPPKGEQDFWGTSMTFELDGEALVFRSAGEDKTFDTPDDIELRTTN